MKEFLEFTEHLAIKSGDLIRTYFRTDYSVEQKSDDSPVTIADKKAEELIREMIMKAYPQHGIIGEEFDDHNPEAEYKWILDPIDGTRSFVCGVPIFGTLIALLHCGEPIVGTIYQPITRELIIGTSDETRFNGEIVKVRPCLKLTDAHMMATDPLALHNYKNIDAFIDLRNQVKVFRGFGDCYGYLMLAIGVVDIMIDAIMNPWDIAALIPVIRGAGGTITDYQGNDPVNGSSAVATGGAIHDQVISILNP